MRSTVRDRVAWSVCLSVGLSVTLVSPAKTAEPIEMPSGLRTWVGPRDHVLDGGSDSPWEGANFWGECASHCKVYGHSTVVCGKTAERKEMPFGLWDPMGPRNRVLHGGPDPPWEGPILEERVAHCKV